MPGTPTPIGAVGVAVGVATGAGAGGCGSSGGGENPGGIDEKAGRAARLPAGSS
jgi:hypothetical protein